MIFKRKHKRLHVFSERWWTNEGEREWEIPAGEKLGRKQVGMGSSGQVEGGTPSKSIYGVKADENWSCTLCFT